MAQNESRYINLLTDYGFKRVFGDEEVDTMTTNIPVQQQQPVFKKVGNIAELVRMTPDELKLYNNSIDTYRTNLSIMKNERAEGIAEGRAEGIAEGRAECIAEEHAKAESEKLDSARQLLGMGLPATQVALALKLPLETVNAFVE